MSDNAQSLSTPDPILTTEGIGGFVVMFIANIYILFGSNLDNSRQTALATIVTTSWIAFQFVHAAIVRKGRASGGGLVGTIINELPVAGSDAGDTARAVTPSP